MRKTAFLLLVLILGTLTIHARAQRGTAAAPPADLVLTNGRIAARTESGEGPIVGRDREDGGRCGDTRQAGPVDLRPRLAPGEVDVETGAERRRLSDARLARQGLAQQSGGAGARQRPCGVR